MNSFIKIYSTLALMVILPTVPLWARDTVESSEKLRILNEATGATAPGTESSFQARLDAMLSTTATAERTYVASQDTEARENARITSETQQELEEKRMKELNPERYDSLAKKDDTKIQDSAGKSLKLDGTNGAYQKIRNDIQGEFDKRIAEKKPAATASAETQPSIPDSDVLDAALKKNPFYHGDRNNKDKESFEERKPLLIGRLMTHGLGEKSAIDYVGQASSDEELILILVRANELTYGEASEVVS